MLILKRSHSKMKRQQQCKRKIATKIYIFYLKVDYQYRTSTQIIMVICQCHLVNFVSTNIKSANIPNYKSMHTKY